MFVEVGLIIVAHRLTTIQNCNKIYEVCEGEEYMSSIYEFV